MGDPCFLPTTIKVLRLRKHNMTIKNIATTIGRSRREKKNQRYQDALRDSLLNLYVLASEIHPANV